MMKTNFLESQNVEITEDTRKVLNDYLVMLRETASADATIAKYKGILESFLSKCQVPLESIAKEDVLKWLNKLTMSKKESTIRSYFACLSSFFKYCIEEGYMKSKITKGIWAPRVPHILPKHLTNEEYEEVNVALENLNIRDKAIILFLFSTGCRSGEIRDLLIEDISLENQTAKVMGKYGKYRYVLFSKECALVLKEYLQSREVRTGDPLFARPNGQSLQPGTIAQVTRRLGEMARLNKSLDSQMCRNTFAKNMLERGASISIVASQMGHANYNSTFKYVQIISKDAKRSELKY